MKYANIVALPPPRCSSSMCRPVPGHLSNISTTPTSARPSKPQIIDVHIAKLSDILVVAQNPTVANVVGHRDLKMMLGFAAYSVFMVGAFGLIGYNYGYNAGKRSRACR